MIIKEERKQILEKAIKEATEKILYAQFVLGIGKELTQEQEQKFKKVYDSISELLKIEIKGD